VEHLFTVVFVVSFNVLMAASMVNGIRKHGCDATRNKPGSQNKSKQNTNAMLSVRRASLC